MAYGLIARTSGGDEATGGAYSFSYWMAWSCSDSRHTQVPAPERGHQPEPARRHGMGYVDDAQAWLQAGQPLPGHTARRNQRRTRSMTCTSTPLLPGLDLIDSFRHTGELAPVLGLSGSLLPRGGSRPSSAPCAGSSGRQPQPNSPKRDGTPTCCRVSPTVNEK